MIDNTTAFPVATFCSSIAGHACANALVARGINATIVGDHISEFRVGGTGNVDVLVPGSQLEQAKHFLAQIKSESNAVEYDEDDSRDASPMSGKIMLVWTIILINLIGLFGYILVSVFMR